LVAAQRFAAFRAVVDDRFGITGWPIAFGQSDVVGISELGDPAPHVVAGGIELLGLSCRVDALGADVVAIARPLLAAAIESTGAVVDWLQRFVDELRICLHGAGAEDLLALRHIGVTPTW
jgi:isopentenyl-diphosphate Delta-isomerase